MECIGSCNSPDGGQLNPQLNATLSNRFEINHASFAGEHSADIVITTEEGDKVTLSSDSKVVASLTTYNRKSCTTTTYAESKGRLFSFDSNREINITLEGDLNDQERKEIKDILKSIFKMIRGFLLGKQDLPEEPSSDFSHLKTIGTVEANFETTQSFASVNQASNHMITSKPAVEKPISLEDGNPESATGFDAVEELTDKMVQYVKDSGISPVKVLKYVDRMFSKLFEGHYKNWSPDQDKLEAAKVILAEFIQKLKALSSESEDDNHPDANKLDNIDMQSDLDQLEKTSLLQVAIFEQTKSFNLHYSSSEEPI